MEKKGFKIVNEGFYSCDNCNKDNVIIFYLVELKPKTDLMLCGSCRTLSKYQTLPVKEIYKVIKKK